VLDGVGGTIGADGVDVGTGGRKSEPYAGNGPDGAGGTATGLGLGPATIGAAGSDG
jgi:hypothetical protein